MNLTNAQVAGVAVAVLGFVFAGAYAVASHTPSRTVPVSPVSVPVTPSASVDLSVTDASVVFKGNNDVPEEHPPTF